LSFTNPAGGVVAVPFLAAGDLVAVTAYDPALTLGRGLIFNLTPGTDFTVGTGTISVLVGLSQFLTFSVSVAKPAQHAAGDQKRYFGDEALHVATDRRRERCARRRRERRRPEHLRDDRRGRWGPPRQVVLRQNALGFWVPDTFVGGEAVYLGNSRSASSAASPSSGR
jgi:hypothetical protein